MNVPSPDVLSATLERLSFSDWSAGQTTLVAPWGFDIPQGISGFYTIRAGGCWLVSDELSAPVRLQSGEVVVLVHGSPHRLCDPLTCPATPFGELYARAETRSSPDTGPAGSTTLVHCHFVLDSWSSKAFQLGLPQTLRCATSPSAATRDMDRVLKVIDDETRSSRPGWQAVVDRLGEVLLLQAIRASLSGDPTAASRGDRNGMASRRITPPDTAIGLVLERMHAELERPWRVSTLAKETHMSRSALSARLVQVVGQSPWRYLTECRMRRACELLRSTTLGVKRIAALVGYESASSFSNAFKRFVGKSPAALRRNGHRLPRGVPRRVGADGDDKSTLHRPDDKQAAAGQSKGEPKE